MIIPLAAMGAGAMFASQFIAFVILAAVLWKLVIPVLGKMLTARSQGIQTKFDDLARETREASESLASIQARLADIGTETKRRIDAALAEGAKARELAIAEANAQAAAELAKAKRTIDSLMTEKLHGRIVDGYLDVVEKAARGR